MTNVTTLHNSTDSIESSDTETLATEATKNSAAMIGKDIGKFFGLTAEQANEQASQIGVEIASGEAGMARHYALEFAVARVDGSPEGRERRYKTLRNSKNANNPYERAKPVNAASWKKQLEKIAKVAAVGVKFAPTSDRFASCWALAKAMKRVEDSNRSTPDLFLNVCGTVVLDNAVPDETALDSFESLRDALVKSGKLADKYATCEQDAPVEDSAESKSSTKTDSEKLGKIVDSLNKLCKSVPDIKLKQARAMLAEVQAALASQEVAAEVERSNVAGHAKSIVPEKIAA